MDRPFVPKTPKDSTLRLRPVELTTVVGLLAVYYVIARWGLEVAALRYAPVTLIWPASGIGLAMILRFGAHLWPLLFVAAAAASWPSIRIVGGALTTEAASVFLIGASAVLQPVVARWAIARFAHGAFLERASSSLVTLLGLLPLSAALATIPLVAGSRVGGLLIESQWGGLLSAWYAMAMSNLIGMVVLAPPILLWMRRPLPMLSQQRALELVGYLAIAAVALSFGEALRPFYLLFAAHVAMAVRVPKPYAATAVALTSIVLLWRATMDLGPADPPPVYQVFLNELTLVLTLNLTAYVTAVLWGEVAERQGQLEARVAERTQALERANDRLQHLSSTDSLTGAWNRRYFDEHTRRELERADHGGSTAALLALDLDHFKRVNDEHGHPTGDSVLEQVVSRLDQQLRPGDLLARVGGEEFVVFLPNCGRETAREVAERLCEAVAEAPIRVDDRSLAITVSIGVAVTRPASDRQGRPLEALLRATIATADGNLFKAKRAGRAQAFGP